MVEKKYSDQELNEAYSSLNDEQKNVLDEHIKMGMKSKWLNVLAKNKGAVLTAEELENPDKAMEKLLDWVLLDYEDSLFINPNTKCECGRSLRYRYTVLHKSTNKIYKLGSVHFEQHTGLSPELVRLIKKGITEVNLERTEILSKVIEKWTMNFQIPSSITVPRDMEKQLSVDLPLLDRQIKRLRHLINMHNKGIEKKPADNKNPKTQKNKQISIFSDIHKEDDSSSVSQEYNQSDLDNINPRQLVYKLKNFCISAIEAHELFLFIKYRKDELHDMGLNLNEIQNYATKALGRIGNKLIRKWLVEIEYIH